MPQGPFEQLIFRAIKPLATGATMLLQPSEETAISASPLQRLRFLTDTIFAVTLVSLSLVFPWPELDRTARNPALEVIRRTFMEFISILATYVIVAFYWVKHVMTFRHLVRIDRTQMALQLAYLFGVFTLPFTVWLTVELGGYATSLIAHSVNLLWIGVFAVLAWVQATRKHRLVGDYLDATVIRQIARSDLVEPIVMVVSVVVAPLGATYWSLSFLLLFIIPLFLKGPGPKPEEAEAPA